MTTNANGPDRGEGDLSDAIPSLDQIIRERGYFATVNVLEAGKALGMRFKGPETVYLAIRQGKFPIDTSLFLRGGKERRIAIPVVLKALGVEVPLPEVPGQLAKAV